MFDAIAPRYDLLNHVLSAGMDRGWRDRAVDALRFARRTRLDLCTGTGDLAMAIVQRVNGATVVGVDFAGEMLRLARVKVNGASLERKIRLVRGDAASIPLPDGSCDGATIGFGIRNVAVPERAPGRVGAGHPARRPACNSRVRSTANSRHPWYALFVVHSGYVLPLIGRLVSKHQSRLFYVSLLPQSALFRHHRSSPGHSLPRVFHRSAPSLSPSASSISLLLSEADRKSCGAGFLAAKTRSIRCYNR